MTRPVLHIGNKRYSSWSLRAWLVLRKAGIEFEENMVPLHGDDLRQRLSALSPGHTVPVLEWQGGVFWDSLAIAEWAAEQAPHLWPRDAQQRALARSATARMHSSFMALRGQCSMDLARTPKAIGLKEETRADIATIQALWNDVASMDGPFLFGTYSIADAFFTPVADRFRAYDIPLHASAQAYCDALLSDPDFLDWRKDALVETFPYSEAQ
ncbi:glutathione S-transferase family protein [Maricaulis parjimensis]|uniref:glutathione S-transferase family protein n=1 Tax=Maricaulis parjimensis TaxID=144023 RepID=UPI0019395460|nr:glutathione S-transferase family protein [Maricaulis parjimensis]